MMETTLVTGNIGIGNTSTLATLNNDSFIIVDQKEIFWKMRRRNAHAFRRGDSAKAEPEEGAQASAARRSRTRGASLLPRRRWAQPSFQVYSPICAMRYRRGRSTTNNASAIFYRLHLCHEHGWKRQDRVLRPACDSERMEPRSVAQLAFDRPL